jgi:hypothetical protein
VLYDLGLARISVGKTNKLSHENKRETKENKHGE